MNLLIVDDEYYCREKIRGLLAQSGVEDVEIREADDGMTAISLCENGFEPDIVFTDVRMPRIDGIDLARGLRSRYPKCEIVFISGYSDKEYLKAAIMLGATGYLEKPFFSVEFNAAFESAVKRRSQMPNYLEEDDIRRLFLTQSGSDMLNTRGDFEKVKERLRDIGVVLPSQGVFAAIITDVGEDFYKSYRPIWETDGILPAMAEGRYALIAYASDCSALQASTQSFLSGLMSRAQEGDVQIYIGAGGVKTSPDTLRESLSEAAKALQTRFFDSEKRRYFIFSPDFSEYDLQSERTDEFDGYIESCRFDDARAFLSDATHRIRRHKASDQTGVRNFYLRLASRVADRAKRLFPGEFEKRPEVSDIWRPIQSAENIDALCVYLYRVVDLYQAFLASRSNQRSYADLAVDWIVRNYSDKALSLNQIATGINLSPAYLSTLFKNERGVSVTRFINNYRIDQACRLLRASRLRISEIADQTGYNDHVYFAKTFRKIAGMTPSEYRELNP